MFTWTETDNYGSPKGTLGEKKVVKIAISFPRNNISFERIIISFEWIIISFERIIISFPRNTKWLPIIRSNEIIIRSNEIIIRSNEIIIRSNEMLFRGNEIAIFTTCFSPNVPLGLPYSRNEASKRTCEHPVEIKNNVFLYANTMANYMYLCLQIHYFLGL